MEATLQIIDGPLKGRFIPLLDGKTTFIGRSSDADYSMFEDADLADQHFGIAFQEGACVLQELATAKSTSVNDRLVKEKIVLKDGDVIRAGFTAFKVTFMSLTDAISAHARQPNAVADDSSSIAQTLTSIPIDKRSDDKIHRDSVGTELSLDIGSGQNVGNGIALQNRHDSAGNAIRPYQTALLDSDIAVRTQALEAAVWTRQTWLLDYLRKCCGNPSSECLQFYEMLAILGEPNDAPNILRILEAEHLGPKRLRLAGIFGHPTCLEFLLPLLNSEDKRVSVAAARSFTKICGQNFDSDIREALPKDADSDGTEADEATSEEATLPDHAKATEHLKKHRNKYAQGTRWCRGVDVSKGNVSDGLENLDQESCWEIRLRSHYSGLQLSHPSESIRFRPFCFQ